MKKSKKNTDKTEWNTSSALQHIWDKSEKCHLDDKYFNFIRQPATYLENMYGLTPVQSLIIAMAIESDHGVSIRSLAHRVDCGYINSMKYESDFNFLYINKFLHRTNNSYNINKEFFDALKSNKPYIRKLFSEYRGIDVLNETGLLLNEMSDEEHLYIEYTKQIRTIINETKHTKLSSFLSTYSDRATIVFLVFAWHRYKYGSSVIDLSTIADYLFDEDYREMSELIQTGKSMLVSKGLIEPECIYGIDDTEHYTLTEQALTSVLSEINFKTIKKSEHYYDLIEPENIVLKPLFYNKEEQPLVERLHTLLRQENYLDLCNRLKEANMPVCFTCFFYGPAGTGKTETVLQICHQTGRAVIQLDMSQIRSKWVGESEKNISMIFKRYNTLVKTSKVAPILLFNEADAIMGRRFTNLDHSADQLNNTIQNIILQELENFEGILIATTNMTANFDPAFERRFLYKIQFNKPDTSIKAQIWRSMMPDISESDSHILAEKYDFSGGQISNIVRKQTIDNILYGNNITLEHIIKLCSEETINVTGTNRHIGF